MKGFWVQLGQKITDFFLWALDEHPGKLIGTSVGFILGLFVVLLGFWRTLILVFFVAIGFIIGKRQDDHKSFLVWVERFFQR